MTWHADEALITAYAGEQLDEARASSIEAHVMQCATCRALVATAVDKDRVDRVWNGIVDSLDAPRNHLVERVLRTFRVSDHLARLLTATRSLTLSWFGGVAIALGFAVGAAYRAPHGLLLFLIVAPLLPLAGVAAAFGPGVDPTYEIGLASPMRAYRLLLIRSVAVLSTTTLLSGVAALALPRLDWTAAAWLLPSLGLTVASLSLATVVDPLWGSAGIAFAWIAAVGVAEWAGASQFALFHAASQVVFAIIVGAAAVVLVARSRFIDIRRKV